MKFVMRMFELDGIFSPLFLHTANTLILKPKLGIKNKSRAFRFCFSYTGSLNRICCQSRGSHTGRLTVCCSVSFRLPSLRRRGLESLKPVLLFPPAVSIAMIPSIAVSFGRYSSLNKSLDYPENVTPLSLQPFCSTSLQN